MSENKNILIVDFANVYMRVKKGGNRKGVKVIDVISNKIQQYYGGVPNLLVCFVINDMARDGTSFLSRIEKKKWPFEYYLFMWKGQKCSNGDDLTCLALISHYKRRNPNREIYLYTNDKLRSEKKNDVNYNARYLSITFNKISTMSFKSKDIDDILKNVIINTK